MSRVFQVLLLPLVGAALAAQDPPSRTDPAPESAPATSPATTRPAFIRPIRVIGSRPAPPFDPPKDLPDPADLCFAAFGDQGTGGPGQLKLASSLARLAPTGPIDLVLLLGDNFYPLGVISVDDRQWRTKFEDVYAADKLSMPFYACLGNHDRLGSAQAQVDYSKREGTRWRMPAPYYAFTQEAKGRKVRFLCVDTYPLTRAKHRRDVKEQLDWVDAELAKPGADWKIAFGHYPLLSNGPHGDAEEAESQLAALIPIFEKRGLDLYLAGHDHTLEWIGPVNGVTYVVSGGGGGADNPHSMTWREDTVHAHTGGGLCLARCTGDSLEVSLRDADGKVLFARPLARKLPVAGAR